jgi:hypothetical protein
MTASNEAPDATGTRTRREFGRVIRQSASVTPRYETGGVAVRLPGARLTRHNASSHSSIAAASASPHVSSRLRNWPRGFARQVASAEITPTVLSGASIALATSRTVRPALSQSSASSRASSSRVCTRLGSAAQQPSLLRGGPSFLVRMPKNDSLRGEL